MTLQPHEMSALVKALAKAFPAYESRMRLAGKAAVASKAQVAGEALEAWRDIVHCAQQEGRLNVLVEAALFEQPENKEIAPFRQVDGTTAIRLQSKGHLWVGLALLAGGAAAFFLKGGGPEVLEPVPVTQAAPVNKGFVVEPEANPEALNQALPNPEMAPEPEPVSENVPEAAPEPVFAQAKAITDITGRCGGPKGSLVGYFYAGDSFERPPGKAFTMERDVNVRADYPRKENAWSSQSKKRCVLVRGDVLLLSAPAIAVDGGKFWVPLYAGDLQKR
jgi:hypothetical protein